MAFFFFSLKDALTNILLSLTVSLKFFFTPLAAPHQTSVTSFTVAHNALRWPGSCGLPQAPSPPRSFDEPTHNGLPHTQCCPLPLSHSPSNHIFSASFPTGTRTVSPFLLPTPLLSWAPLALRGPLKHWSLLPFSICSNEDLIFLSLLTRL